MPNKMPNQKSNSASVTEQQRRRILVGAGAATLAVGAVAIGMWQLFPGKSGKLDLSSGLNLLPQDTLLSATISTDPERWQKFQEFGIPESRGIIQAQITKIQTDFLTNYGYDYQRDIQPWIGKQILFAYLHNPAATPAKSSQVKLPQQQLVAILPIANPAAAQQVLGQHQTPIDANLVESSYKGVSIKETKRKAGTIAIAILDNFVAIATDKLGLQQIIDTYQGAKSLVSTPGYTKALTEIEINRPFAQIYVNIPVATAVAAANSPQTLAPEQLAQAQVQQGIAVNASLESEGIAWKGISWLKPTTKQKLLVENQGENLAERLPANTLVMLSGGNLPRLWLDYVRSAESNPITPIKPPDLVKNLGDLTGLDLQADLLNWSKGPFGMAIIPKTVSTEASDENPIDTELGAGLVLIHHAKDRPAAEKAFAKLDRTMNQKQAFTVKPGKLAGKDVTNWSSPLGGTAATHGWLDNNLAFLSLGAPVASSFVPAPAQRLANNPLFQQSTRSSLKAHNGQFFIDLDRTINAGNLPLPYVSPEVAALFKAMRSLGVTSAILDETSNRFDMFVTLQKVPGIAKLPTAPKKVLKPSPTPSKSPSPQ